MLRKLNGTAKWAGVILTALAALGGVVWAQANAANQIDANTTSIEDLHDDIRKNQQLLVKITHHLSIDVSVLFSK